MVRRTAPELKFSPAEEASVRWLEEHLRRLRALPAHGNRTLCYDQLFIALLLGFFNPTVRSLRLIELCGDFNGKLDLDRLARSTTADALKVFDPKHLQPIIDDLNRRVGRLRKDDPTLQNILWQIIAGDGTYLTILSDVAWALRHRRRDGRVQGQVRLNVQLDVQTWAPQVLSVSGGGGGTGGGTGGDPALDGSEPAAFAKDLLGGVLYVFDRNFLDFSFLELVLQKHSHFVLRVKDNAPAVKVLRSLAITPQDAAAGVVSDRIVTLTGRGAPAGEFRRVTIHTTDRHGEPEVIRLLTDLTDEQINARTIGEVYRRRWQIELFFKWLKTWAGLDQLLSTSRNGITFQFYVAVIGVLLMAVQTGRRVSRYAVAALHLLLHGQITLQQMMQNLEKLEREKERARQRAAARRAIKKLA